MMTLATSNRPDTLRLGVLLAGLAPCAFCGISAAILAFASMLLGPPPTPGIFAGIFCALSGALGLFLCCRASAFVVLPRPLQVRIAVAVWAMHLMAAITVGVYAWALSW